MAFYTSNNLARFNSANSSELIRFYESFVIDKINEGTHRVPSKTFAPSSFRCDRKCWFRLRGTEPDGIKYKDASMQFKADIGTSCHRIIQTNLQEALGVDWIDPEDYLKSYDFPYDYILTRNDPECFIELTNPPFRFACDGIIKWKGQLYLIEIKTVEYGAFNEMTDPRIGDLDQVKCYSTLLGINKVLFIYQERLSGGIKCYEVTIDSNDQKSILDKIEHVQSMNKSNIAPDRLPSGDKACSTCEYSKKCREWG